ncbi:integrase [Bradyrhizobium sp. JR7.2]|uniref:hypothetical protein n=2 Tax=unclassified Bradyrhizobium TaxID=2631580 RepID=UPI00339B2841
MLLPNAETRHDQESMAAAARQSKFGLLVIVNMRCNLSTLSRPHPRQAVARARSEQKLQPKTVQTYIGHTMLQMTMDTYGHMFPSGDHAKAMDTIAAELFS